MGEDDKKMVLDTISKFQGHDILLVSHYPNVSKEVLDKVTYFIYRL